MIARHKDLGIWSSGDLIIGELGAGNTQGHDLKISFRSDKRNRTAILRCSGNWAKVPDK